MQEGTAAGSIGEAMGGSHLGVGRRELRYVDARQQNGFPGQEQLPESKADGDTDVSSAKERSSGVDGEEGLQEGAQEDEEELQALRQSVFDMLPSKEAKDLWLDQQQKRSAREWEEAPSSSAREDGESSLDSRPGLSSIPTLRQVKARAKAVGHDQGGIARLRKTLLVQFDRKEELKQRFRLSRDPNVRTSLMAVQQEYAQTKAAIADLINRVHK